MFLGFIFACYSVVGNDVIQTLGTFLTSNEHRPWWVLWMYAGSILAITLILGYTGAGAFLGGNDVAFDRLDKIHIPETLSVWYVLPPIILLVITRLGIPVSTTFLILSFFSISSFPGMLNKSLVGYALAFVVSVGVYLIISQGVEKLFQQRPLDSDHTLWTRRSFWTGAQWLSTAFLWSQWLTQDLANIYIYLGNPEELGPGTFIFSLFIILGMLAYIFYQKGGAIQNIVRAKTNTADIRSATFIDLIYGLILLVFKQDILGMWDAKLPMSTTWVFLGLLAGRELAIRIKLGPKPDQKLSLMLFSDLGKAALGLIISIALVLFLYLVEGRDTSMLFQ
ncbi:MAG: hypothetical protein D6730_15310 [Bacteroidetes bacterium]|nr:MAG: hypothetical protein D6730_15310 [Bacteroidota bacterium]